MGKKETESMSKNSNKSTAAKTNTTHADTGAAPTTRRRGSQPAITTAAAPEAAAESAPAAFASFLEETMKRVKMHGEALKVEDEQNFVKITGVHNGHKVYLAKQVRTVSRIDTTLPIAGKPGTIPLEKKNGRVTCHIEPTVDNMVYVLSMLASDKTTAIPAPKRRQSAPKIETPAT